MTAQDTTRRVFTSARLNPERLWRHEPRKTGSSREEESRPRPGPPDDRHESQAPGLIDGPAGGLKNVGDSVQTSFEVSNLQDGLGHALKNV